MKTSPADLHTLLLVASSTCVNQQTHRSLFPKRKLILLLCCHQQSPFVRQLLCVCVMFAYLCVLSSGHDTQKKENARTIRFGDIYKLRSAIKRGALDCIALHCRLDSERRTIDWDDGIEIADKLLGCVRNACVPDLFNYALDRT